MFTHFLQVREPGDRCEIEFYNILWCRYLAFVNFRFFSYYRSYLVCIRAGRRLQVERYGNSSWQFFFMAVFWCTKDIYTIGFLHEYLLRLHCM